MTLHHSGKCYIKMVLVPNIYCYIYKSKQLNIGFCFEESPKTRRRNVTFVTDFKPNISNG